MTTKWSLWYQLMMPGLYQVNGSASAARMGRWVPTCRVLEFGFVNVAYDRHSIVSPDDCKLFDSSFEIECCGQTLRRGGWHF